MIQQEQEQQQEQFEPLPEFAQIQGQKIRLRGLDYSLLQKQTQLQKKEKLMKQIKSKLTSFAHKMPVQRLGGSALTQDNDELTKNIMLSMRTKPAVTQYTYYLFSLQPQFSPHLPQVITRRFGRMHSFPLYAYHKQQEVKQFCELIELDDKIRRLRREQQKQAKKTVPLLNFDQESDEDDIFAAKSESGDELNIKVGNKLTFGIAEQDIFGGPRYKQVVKEVEEAPKVTDKYDFLRKKRKPNQQQLGYDECYVNTGPSLQQMKEMRKEGIQIFGDAKEYVQKQKKYNINQDYAKIKRIIDQKSKKT